MFLTFLSASLIALGLMSGAMGFSSEFLTITVLILALDLFIGLATMGRVSTATDEDIRYLQGMNRIRHAYHEAVRGLEPTSSPGSTTTSAGIFGVSSADVEFRSRRSIIHGFTTVVGMVGVINAALAGVLVATIVLLIGAGIAAVVAGVVTFTIALLAAVYWLTRATASTVEALEVKFPTPASGTARPANAAARSRTWNERAGVGALAEWLRCGLLPDGGALGTRALVAGTAIELGLEPAGTSDLVALDVLLALGRGGGLFGLGGLLVVGHRSGLLSPPRGSRCVAPSCATRVAA